jgi:hypothetical protein
MHSIIVGHFFFAENMLTGGTYLDMLEAFCFPQLVETENPDIMFQLDGAPPHFSNTVQDTLNEKFPEKWIGRGGLILWPARSPDLVPLDFFVWGHVKNTVYAEKSWNKSSE